MRQDERGQGRWADGQAGQVWDMDWWTGQDSRTGTFELHIGGCVTRKRTQFNLFSMPGPRLTFPNFLLNRHGLDGFSSGRGGWFVWRDFSILPY